MFVSTSVNFFNLTVLFSVSIVSISIKTWCCKSPCKPNCNQGILCRGGSWCSSGKSWRLLAFHPSFLLLTIHPGTDKLAILPPQTAPSTEINALKAKLSHTMEEIRAKNSNLTVHDLRRLLFRCAATLISLKKVRPAISSVADFHLQK